MSLAIPGLHDIHLPPAAGWWPPAPGWWVLAGLLIAALAWMLRRTSLARRRSRRLAAALREFDGALGAGQDAPSRLAAASSLLRRAARIHHPSAASLDGGAWLEFLDGGDPARPFSRGQGAVFADGAFRRHLDADIEPALALARTRFANLFTDESGGRGHA